MLFVLCSPGKGAELLTEQEVSRSWHQLFKGGVVDAKTLDRAEALLDELRPESPLRHRLATELDELRELERKRSKKVAQPA